ELKNKDIPHRSHIRNRIIQMMKEHLDELEKELGASVGKISCTMDCWTDPNLTPFMAVTAHWIS
ncbi:hypothetical protein K435DRAFT_625180, partial [Dendrothele bispora CBS 962.96]